MPRVDAVATAALLAALSHGGCASTRTVGISSSEPSRVFVDGVERCASTPCDVELPNREAAAVRVEPLDGVGAPLEANVAAAPPVLPWAVLTGCVGPPAFLVSGIAGAVLVAPFVLTQPGACAVPFVVGLFCAAPVMPIIAIALVAANQPLDVLRFDLKGRRVYSHPPGWPVGLDGAPPALEVARSRAKTAGTTVRFSMNASTTSPAPNEETGRRAQFPIPGGCPTVEQQCRGSAKIRLESCWPADTGCASASGAAAWGQSGSRMMSACDAASQ